MREKLYSINDVADVLGVKYGSIYGEIQRGNIHAAKVGKRYVIQESELDKYKEKVGFVPHENGFDAANYVQAELPLDMQKLPELEKDDSPKYTYDRLIPGWYEATLIRCDPNTQTRREEHAVQWFFRVRYGKSSTTCVLDKKTPFGHLSLDRTIENLLRCNNRHVPNIIRYDKRLFDSLVQTECGVQIRSGNYGDRLLIYRVVPRYEMPYNDTERQANN